jgi:nickel/cobalt transporter (NicO) family protein
VLSWRVAVISESKRSMLEIQKWLFSSATAELRNFTSGASALSVLAAMAVAMLFGFVHALMPGHGKVALVSYYLAHPARLATGIGTSAVLVATHVGSAVILVLAGLTVIRATLGGVGRAPALETASAVSVIVVGIWLLVRSVRHDHTHLTQNAGFVAVATGLVPCPLTTFIMVYSVANGIMVAGLLITAAMAMGMIATIFIFVGCTMILRERALRFFERTALLRERVGRSLEIISSLVIVAFGLWLFATRAT